MPFSRSRKKLVVVADDFTGATDAGVQFRKAGFEVNVIIDTSQLSDAFTQADVVVVDLESRFDQATVAYEKCFQLASKLGDPGDIILYKKMDSTFRGNVGAEIDGLMDGLHIPVAFFAPALPVYGRTTENGEVLVRGVPLLETEAADDPRTPVLSSRIADILGHQSRRAVSEISTHLFTESARTIDEILLEKIDHGAQILIFDSTRETDLRNVALAIDRLQHLPMLIVGSAGLALHLPDMPFIRKDRLAFVFSGSVSEKTSEQVKHTVAEGNCELFFIDGSGLLYDSNVPGDIINRVSEKVNQGIRRFVFTTALSRGDVETVSNTANSLGLSLDAASEKIAQGMGRFAAGLINTFHPTGVLLTGGDTAIKTVEALHASGMSIREEILPGIQAGTLTGCSIGTVFATKSGGFGEADAITKTLEFFKV